jgi:hypothetical protein
MYFQNSSVSVVETSIMKILSKHLRSNDCDRRADLANGGSKLKCAVPLLLAMTFFGAMDANAANYYVRAGASGNGSDWSSAAPSLPSALNRGDVYYIADGAYAGRTFGTAVSGTTPITIKKATVADHGTSVGWSDAYGDGQATFSSGFVFTSSYWVIDGQTGGGASNNWSGNFGFKITELGDGNAVIKTGQGGTSDNITIRHVDLQGIGHASNSGGSASNDGLAIYGSSNITLSYFRMTGIGRCPFFVSPKNAVFEHGWVQSYYGSSAVHSEVASIWGFSGSVGDVTFRYNLFTDIQSTGGIMWDNSSNNSAKLNVYGNVFYKPPGATWQQANGLVGGWTGGGGEQYRNATVSNNTFINVDQDSLSTLPNVYSGNAAYNNLFYNSNSPDFAKYGVHDYNYVINSGSIQESNAAISSSGDPFVNAAGLDFRLKAATVAGIARQAPFNLDPLGKTRGADGVTDRGAFEFGISGGPTLSPPMSLQVK